MTPESSKLTWDDLIKEAEERIKMLKSSLRYFKEMKDLGQPFPLDFPRPTSEDRYLHVEQ